MTETGSIDTSDRDGRSGEGRGFARLLWRALFIAAFAAMALLVADSPASADDCATDGGECAEAAPADHEAEAEDPAPEGRHDPLALVTETALAAVKQILGVPDRATVDPTATDVSTTATETSPRQPEDRPIVHQDGTPSPETGPAGPAPASRLPSPTDEKPATKSTVDLALDLTRDLTQAPRAVTTRVNETVTLVDQRPSSSSDQMTGSGQGGLSAVTTTLTAALPVLELDRIVAPVLTRMDDALTRPLKPVTQLIDPIVVPVLEMSVENTGAALNPVGHRPSGLMPTPTDDGGMSTTDTATESTGVAAVGGPTRSRVPSVPVGTEPASSRSQTRALQPDQLDPAPQARSAVAVPASDANVPAPGLDSGDGSGAHGVGSSGGSSADTGKVVMGTLRLPGRSSAVGDVVDRWQLPRSFGSEPGHSPD